ncbi:CDP-diacylglycerol--serine O-phosphatidyltransferase [Psychrobium sp. 1_MG-2023]|uniref:CDP-diacylglycerol--serine O-phosphatidyltransferase n=1 Tax=Psychrobium sp. 1_MG-2023 TaxID=3062624 RepID=UPI000C338176|nr:CDP-diacylglycerol--serine O-phosphatidyltransferase [Psychrobium sp. 1_MG-2023]MDP2562028.1 CDP-diacylglycerol--serine O-phosphatidyltransferase [Psychrobium sp. 1_MG-2023]PKF58515.1 CDP-diacylglycerol--serine O-phosphatidyltransferase [Alteromonadales bacterium alter-6D02]
MVNLYRRKQLLETLPSSSVSAADISVLLTAKDYLTQLLSLINSATTRIYITALYLENDEAGRLVVEHLIAAKQRCPELEIKVFVDFHRARRGLIGQKNSEGNAAFYRDIDIAHPDLIKFYGVAVKQRELFGVLHLKGLVIDDTLLYTGASINNIYLHYKERYRYDRYCTINSIALSDSFVDYLNDALIPSEGVYLFNRYPLVLDNKFKKKVANQHKQLSRVKYQLPQHSNADLTVTPLIGLGKRNNQLNKVIHQQMLQAQDNLVLYTPYFNLPGVLKRDIARLLRRKIKIEIIVGDKRASDFFIPEDQPFNKIGLVPYLYETTLLQFVKRHQKSINNGLLTIRLWQHDNNSFHLKGMKVDDRYHLLTGNNLNPRAWRLDIENGLMIDDKQGQLIDTFAQEHQQIIKHTTEVKHWNQIQTANDYPLIVRKWLNRLRRTNLDKLFKQYM